MTKRTAAPALLLGVAIATVASALALGGSAASQPPAPPAAGPIKVSGEPKTARAAQAPKAGDVVKKQAAVRTPATKFEKNVVIPAPAVAFNADGQAQQYMQQFRPILRAEYHIVRLACRLTPDQRTEIARAGEQSLREAARKYIEMMHRPMTAAQRAALDPRKQIRDGLSNAVKSRLSGEMAARYQDEIGRREASRKQLAVRNLVARLDRDLVLSPGQRDKVAESLASHWDDSWCPSIEIFMHDYQFLPPIPDRYVAPFLNDAQKTIWRGTQKYNGFFGGFGMMGGIMVEDPLEDDELRVARQEASRNDPKPDPNQPAAMRRGALMPLVAPQAVVRDVIVTTKTQKVQDKPNEAKPSQDSVKEKAVQKK
jgi:hypothetical protein